MKNFLKRLFFGDDRTFGAVRSGRWEAVRNQFLKENPFCAVCGTDKKVVPHHKKPFNLFPELELIFSNLVPLCESNGMNCHITFGHCGNFRSYNPEIDRDVTIWRAKITTRP